MHRSKGKRLAFEILFALLLCLLLLFILVTEISRARGAYFYERADTVTYIKTDALCGYLFRDEIAAGTLNNGAVDYCVQDGEAVRAADELAHVYRDDSGKDERERAAALYTQIAELEAKKALADADTWKSTYVNEYAALMRDLSAGALQDALSHAENTATALGSRDTQKDPETLQARLNALQSDLDKLIADAPDYLTTKAGADGIFYHTADGYEALFGTNRIADLTPAALNTLLAAQPVLNDVIGKLVCDGPWYLAVPLDRTLAETYVQGASYPVHFAGGSTVMLLERIYTDDSESALLILAAAETPAWLSPARTQAIRVEKSRISGICVPADALSEDNTLFVLENGVARLRHVTPVLCDRGRVLLSPLDREQALTEGEYVIVSTKQLFDGKVLE